MKDQHTQGNWEIFERNGIIYIHTDKSPHIATVEYPRNGACMPQEQERQANAKLIAAAPELLEAAHKINNVLQTWGIVNLKEEGLLEAYEALNDAIQKAIS